MSRSYEKLQGFIQSLHHAVHHTLMIQGMDKDKADIIAEDITDSVLDEFGGENLYIPRNISGKTAKRNAKIYDEFTGSNHDALAKKYGVTLQRMYAIIKAEADRIKKQRQPSLFDESC